MRIHVHNHCTKPSCNAIALPLLNFLDISTGSLFWWLQVNITWTMMLNCFTPPHPYLIKSMTTWLRATLIPCFIWMSIIPLFFSQFFSQCFPPILTPSHPSQHCPIPSHPYLSKVLCRLFCVFAWRSASAVKLLVAKSLKCPWNLV